MKRNCAALTACTGLIAAAFLAAGCGATPTTGTASKPAITTSQPAGLASIPSKRPPAKPAVVPKSKPTTKTSTKKPTKKPTVHLTTSKPKPKPTPSPSPTKPKPTKTAEDVYYANCSEVRAAGKAPIHRGDPGYSSKLDRDNDGVACEN